MLIPPTTFQYRDQFYSLCPPWLTTGNAEKYMYTMELSRDLLLEKMNQAIRFRLPGLGDSSQLAYLAYDRQLSQGPAETDASFVSRLRGAFGAWAHAGARNAVLWQLQAYLQNLQPGVDPSLPMVTIVGPGSAPNAVWATLYNGDTIGVRPTLTTIRPGNFFWDAKNLPWRNWLVLYMSLVESASGTGASTTTAAPSASFTSPGRNVNGVWVPAITGTPVNSPWLTVTGLAGLTNAHVGQWLTLSGSLSAENNSTFPIVTVLSGDSCVVAAPKGVPADAGPLTWSVGAYPFVGPGQVWGAPGSTFGQGELQPPPIDTGSNVGGVWQPTLSGTSNPTASWGLTCSAQLVTSLRQILKSWKSARTYYDQIVFAFDGGTGVAGDAYSANSGIGSGNPDGTFGSVGMLQEGVWVPTRIIESHYDAYCQGTGSWNQCTVPNVT